VPGGGALGVGTPLAGDAVLVVTGHRRDPMPLGIGATLGLLYCIGALYAGYTDRDSWLRVLQGEGVLLALLPAAITALWAGITAGRRKERRWRIS
jgi:hypothetical protein